MDGRRDPADRPADPDDPGRDDDVEADDAGWHDAEMDDSGWHDAAMDDAGWDDDAEADDAGWDDGVHLGVDRPRRRRRPWWVQAVAVLLVAAFVGGAGAGVVQMLRSGDDGPSARDAARFVDAWERRLRGTWAVEGQSLRSRLDGTAGELRTPFRAAQRPPDRIVQQYGSVEARIDGRSIGCGPAADGGDGQLVCADRGPADDHEAAVGAELLRLRALVAGGAPAYLVDEIGDGCFALAIVKADPAPPLGETARFCFDATTGAMTASEIVSVGVVDRTIATDVRADVTDADFALPPHRTA